MRFLKVSSLLLIFASLSFSFQAQSLPYETENIQEAAFRYLIQKYSRFGTFCLSLGTGRTGYKDPEPSFMRRFGEDLRVAPASQCIQNKIGPSLKGDEPVLLTVTEVKRKSDTEATARLEYFQNLKRSGGGFCQLQKSRDGSWKVVRFKPVIIQQIK